jgi:hypothetical protein
MPPSLCSRTAAFDQPEPRSAYDMAASVGSWDHVARNTIFDAGTHSLPVALPPARSAIQQIGDLIDKLTFTEALALDSAIHGSGYAWGYEEDTAQRLVSLTQIGARLSA